MFLFGAKILAVWNSQPFLFIVLYDTYKQMTRQTAHWTYCSCGLKWLILL